MTDKLTRKPEKEGFSSISYITPIITRVAISVRLLGLWTAEADDGVAKDHVYSGWALYTSSTKSESKANKSSRTPCEDSITVCFLRALLCILHGFV